MGTPMWREVGRMIEQAWLFLASYEVSLSRKLRYGLVCFALVPLASPAVAECLKSNVEGQSAQGQLAIGRARDAAGRPETPYILRLASNTCLDAGNRDDAFRRARTIHLFPADENMRRTFRLLAGKAVAVRGRPSIAYSAHHHARIVMHVTEINAR